MTRVSGTSDRSGGTDGSDDTNVPLVVSGEEGKKQYLKERNNNSNSGNSLLNDDGFVAGMCILVVIVVVCVLCFGYRYRKRKMITQVTMVNDVDNDNAETYTPPTVQTTN